MTVKIISGNIFTTQCQTLVNTVNCVGVMGAGIALECRLRYPEMHQRYVNLCSNQKINIGTLWIYKAPERWILNFPTKRHWKYPSKMEFLHAGLEKFSSTYKDKAIESIAFPLLGADKGGIPQQQSLDTMMNYLEGLDIDIEIYRYDPRAKDDLFDKTKEWLVSKEIDYIAQETGLRKDYVAKVVNSIQSPDIAQLNQLARVKGIGIKTLEKIFRLARNAAPDRAGSAVEQKSLL